MDPQEPSVTYRIVTLNDTPETRGPIVELETSVTSVSSRCTVSWYR